MSNYIKWDDSRVEHKDADEDEIIAKICKQFNTIQDVMFNAHGHCFGGTHAFTHGLVKGELVVHDNLPEHLKQTMFSEPRTYPFAMRYSSEPGDPALDDKVPAPRGLGMKVFNVPGEKFHQNEDDGVGRDVHDIEFNSAPILELANAKTCYDIVNLRMTHGGCPHILSQHLDKRDDGHIQQMRNHLPNNHLVAQKMWSQSAYRYGDYVCKYRIIPDSEAQTKLAEKYVDEDCSANVLRDWMQEYFKNNDAQYLFQVQLLQNIEDQPVEDSKYEWDEKKYPFETVATLKIPKQESYSYKRRTFWQDHMRLDPWHGLKSFKPLGSINRTRKDVYQASSDYRRKMNAREEITLKNIDEIPN